MKEGYYYFVHFDAEATVPAESRAAYADHGQCSQIFMRETGSIRKERYI